MIVPSWKSREPKFQASQAFINWHETDYCDPNFSASTPFYGLPPNCLDEAPFVDSQRPLTHNNFHLDRGHPCLRRRLSHPRRMSYKYILLLLTIVVINFALVAAPAHAGFGGSAVHSFTQGHYGWAIFFLFLGIAASILNAGKKKSDQSE